jgi:transposase InsO family protein
MAELCRAFSVSRKTGYKWWKRFEEGGLSGLGDRSRRCHEHRNSTDPTMVAMVVAVRKRHPTWGPKKLHAWLRGKGYEPPARSTIGAILRRAGLAHPKRRGARTAEYADGLSAQDRPNAVWSADFKGWFKLSSGQKCYPLTITDGFSRYLIRCDALEHPDAMASREVFESAFTEFGLPEVLRTDNGTPFSGRHGISALSVWWVKLGIKPERIRRGKPTENGRHERMHRTLKADAIRQRPLASKMRAQQLVFDEFRAEFNDDRPHEALDMKTPREFYEASPRAYTGELRSPTYDPSWGVGYVGRDGQLRVGGKAFFVSQVLRGEPVGIRHAEDGGCEVFYGPLKLATITASGKLRRGGRTTRCENVQEQPLAAE